MKTWRVTGIAWVGLGLSVAGVALVVTTLWMFLQTLECGESDPMSPVASLWPWSLLATMCAFTTAITFDTIAGTRTWGNRVVGIMGGLMLLTSPILVMFLAAQPNLLS